MDRMLIAEAECPPEQTKPLPPTNPKLQKQAPPVVLQRAVASISSKRAALTKTAVKLVTLKTKAATSGKEKDEIAAVCHELKVKAAENRLTFVLNRWDMLGKLAQANLDAHVVTQQKLVDDGKATDDVDATIKKLQALLSFGGQQAGFGREHAEKHGEEGFQEPPFTELKYDYNSYSGLSAGGAPFDVVTHVEKGGLAAAPLPVPAPPAVPFPAPAVFKAEPEPEPDLPLTISTAAISEIAKLKASVKAAALKHVADGGTGSSSYEKTMAAAVEAGFGGVTPDDDEDLNYLLITALGEVKKASLDELTPDQHAALSAAAGQILQASIAELGVEGLATTAVRIGNMKKLRSVSAGVLGSSYVTMGLADKLMKQAKESWLLEPKPFDQHGAVDQEQLKEMAKAVAVSTEKHLAMSGTPASAGVPAVADGLQAKASAAGLGISSAAAMTLAQQAIAALPKEEPKAAPDEAGFLQAIDDALSDTPATVPIPMTFGGVVFAMDEQPDISFVGLMSHHHIEKVKGTPLESKVVAMAVAVAKAQWNEPKLKQLVFAAWDKLAADGTTLHQVSFVNHANVWLLNGAEAIEVGGGWNEAIQEFGNVLEPEDWLNKIWPEWAKTQEPPVDVAKATAEFVKEVIDSGAVYADADGDMVLSPEGQKKLEALAKAHYPDDGYVLGYNTNPIVSSIEAALAAKPVDVGDDASLAVAQGVADTMPAGVASAPKPIELPPGMPTIDGYTKKTKLSKASDLTTNQEGVLAFLVKAAVSAGLPWTKAGKLKTNLGGVAGGIIKQFKTAYQAAGLKLMINKKIVAGALSAAVAEGSNHPAWQLHGGYLQLSVNTMQTALFGSAYHTFNKMAKQVFIDQLWADDPAFPGPFKSKKQQNLFATYLAKCQAIAPAAEPAATVTAPAPAAAGGSVGQLFGMSGPELLQFATGAPMPDTKMAPAIGHGWTNASKDLQDSGGSQGSEKKFLSATMDGKKFTDTGKAPASFMGKLDGYRSLGESAANRTQALIGLGGAGADGYLMKHNGGDAFMQWFQNTPNGRTIYGHGGRPWMGMVGHGKSAPPEGERQALTHGLQMAAVSNWLIDDKDDHGGNFTFDENGQFAGIDHGQTGKFFDSTGTLLSTWNWTTNDIANKDSGASLEANKGWPKRMLKDWAEGADLADGKHAIPLMPLTDPTFEAMINRAEGVPDDVYDAMWRPYATGATKRGKGKLARYSHNPKDRTVDGFVQGMQDRRKTIRKQVAELYGMLAKTRAAALKKHGDARPLGEIEAEVREQLGIDKFAAGEVLAAPVAAPDAGPAEHADTPGWDEDRLPAVSHVPAAEDVKQWGVKGYDMAVGGDAVKDGRVTFRQLGDVPMCSFMLESPARAALQSRLPGYAGGEPPPPKPTDPHVPAFTPPLPPAFDQSNESLAATALAGALHADDPTNYTGISVPGLAGERLTKVEKYANKWRDGALSPPKGSKYWVRALTSARGMKISADPVVAASGGHYEAELLKFGTEGGEHGFTFKDPAEVPADEQKIKPFVLTPELEKDQEAAKANIEEAYAKQVEAAEAAHKIQVEEIQTTHAQALAVWQDKLDAFNAKTDLSGMLMEAKAIGKPVMPTGVKQLAGDNKTVSAGASWDGAWGSGPGWMTGKAYEIDLTDVVTQLGMTTTGEKDNKFKVVYNTGGTSASAPGHGLASAQGQVYVQFPKNVTSAQMKTLTQRAFEILGIDSRPASRQDHELNYARKLAWLLKLEGAHAAGGVGGDARWHAVEPPEGSRQERIDYWLGRLRSKLGYDPRMEPKRAANGDPKTGPDGKAEMTGKKNPHWQPVAVRSSNKLAHRRPDYDDKGMAWLMKTKQRVLTQRSSSRRGKILQGAMMSTMERQMNGITKSTSSQSSDAQSGGALSVFLYNRTVGNMRTGGNAGTGDLRMLIHPAMHLFTNTYSQPSDHYGSKVDKHRVQARQTSLKEQRVIVEIASPSSKNLAETMVNDQIDLFRWCMYYKEEGHDHAAVEKHKTALAGKSLDELKKVAKENHIKLTSAHSAATARTTIARTLGSNARQLAAKLKAAGHHTIGMPPRPIEQVIVPDFTDDDVRELLKSSAAAKEWTTL